MRLLLFVALSATLPMFAAVPIRGKQAPQKPDAAIEQAIRAKFAKSKIAEDKFVVKVQNGIAVLEGSTDVVQRKGVATRLAKSGGATAVDNRIRVSEAARQKAAKQLAEGRQRAAARRQARSEVPRPLDTTTKPASMKAPKAAVAVPASAAVRTVVPASEKPVPVPIKRAQIKH